MAKKDEKQNKDSQTGSGDEPGIQYVMMRRLSDGDGPHPIHPDEVENYKAGDWVVVEEQ